MKSGNQEIRKAGNPWRNCRTGETEHRLAIMKVMPVLVTTFALIQLHWPLGQRKCCGRY